MPVKLQKLIKKNSSLILNKLTILNHLIQITKDFLQIACRTKLEKLRVLRTQFYDFLVLTH